MAKGQPVRSRKRVRCDEEQGFDDGGDEKASTTTKQRPVPKLDHALNQMKIMFLEQADLWKTFADSLEEKPESVHLQQPWASSMNGGMPTSIFAERAPPTPLSTQVMDLHHQLHQVRMHIYERESETEVEKLENEIEIDNVTTANSAGDDFDEKGVPV
jgi:hypothetical protein